MPGDQNPMGVCSSLIKVVSDQCQIQINDKQVQRQSWRHDRCFCSVVQEVYRSAPKGGREGSELSGNVGHLRDVCNLASNSGQSGKSTECTCKRVDD